PAVTTSDRPPSSTSGSGATSIPSPRARRCTRLPLWWGKPRAQGDSGRRVEDRGDLAAVGGGGRDEHGSEPQHVAAAARRFGRTHDDPPVLEEESGGQPCRGQFAHGARV